MRRRIGEEFRPECTLPTIKHPTGVMVWGCMAASGVGRLSVCEGMMNGDKYVSTREKVMIPSAKDVFNDGRRWYFQDDNAPCHHAKKVKA